MKGSAMFMTLRLAVVVLLIGLPVHAQQVDEGRFDVILRGIKAGQLVFRGEQSGTRYAVAGKVESTGLIGRLVRFSYDATARGTVNGTGYIPNRYTEDADTGKRQSSSSILYKAGVPQVEVIKPPRAPAPFDLNPATQGGTVDTLTALYAILRDVAPDTACKAKIVMFDGRRRTQLTLTDPKKQENGTLKCSGEYTRLAGFSPEDMAERSRFPLTMTLSPAGDKLRVTEVRTPTLYGDAVLRRR
jgi:hypothetical protein